MLCSTRFPGSTAEAAPAEGLVQKLQGVEVFDLSGKAPRRCPSLICGRKGRQLLRLPAISGRFTVYLGIIR
jgi:hypothetical protein